MHPKRVVSQKGGFGECTPVPVCDPGEHAKVPSFRFSLRGNVRMYPRPGNMRQNHPFVNPRETDLEHVYETLWAGGWGQRALCAIATQRLQSFGSRPAR